jgi:hypothetical protein
MLQDKHYTNSPRTENFLKKIQDVFNLTPFGGLRSVTLTPIFDGNIIFDLSFSHFLPIFRDATRA